MVGKREEELKIQTEELEHEQEEEEEEQDENNLLCESSSIFVNDLVLFRMTIIKVAALTKLSPRK